MPKDGTYPGSQRPAETVASGFFVGSNRAEKCGSVKEPWRQAVGRGCQIFPERSHSVTELYYVKKDTSRLHGITDGFNL